MTTKPRIDEMPEGAVLEVMTRNSTYKIEKLTDGFVLISGHPKHCPKPILTQVCRFKSSDAYLDNQTMLLEYRHPVHGMIRTSHIQQVRGLAGANQSIQ